MQTIGNPRILRRALTLKTGQITSYISGDDGDLEIGENHNYEVLTSGQYSGNTNIVLGTVPKTEIKNNACVKDWSTGLMWSRTVSASVGATSNGLLPYTPNANLESLSHYIIASNNSSFAGYSDWRWPTILELYGLSDMEQPNGLPDARAFPSGWLNVGSSTSLASAATINYIYMAYGNGIPLNTVKTSATSCALVRKF